MLGLQRRGIKEDRDHGVAVFDDLFLCLQQLVCRPEEGRLNLLIRQVGRVAGLVAIVLVIAAPDDRLFFSLVYFDLT